MFISQQNLRHEALEFNQMQALIRGDWQSTFANIVSQYGLVKNNQTGAGVWLVTQNGNNAVNIAAGNAIILDANNMPTSVSLTSSLVLSVPSINGTYNIFLNYLNSSLEAGTITLTNSSNIVNGVGTSFTKIFGSNRQLIAGGVSYLINSVVSDTEVILTNNYTGVTTSGLSFSVGGYFITNPSFLADNIIYEHDGLQIVATTAAQGTGDYFLATVVVAGGIITTVTDQRSQNIFTTNTSIVLSFTIPHTWTIPGGVAIAAGDIGYINPFFVAAPTGQTVQLVGLTSVVHAGSATVKIAKTPSGGAYMELTGYTAVNVGGVPATIGPSAISLANNDMLQLVVSAASAAQNLSVTVFLQYTIVT